MLGLFFERVIHGCFYNQALADVWSTCAGFEYLYCSILHGPEYFPSRNVSVISTNNFPPKSLRIYASFLVFSLNMIYQDDPVLRYTISTNRSNLIYDQPLKTHIHIGGTYFYSKFEAIQKVMKISIYSSPKLPLEYTI